MAKMIIFLLGKFLQPASISILCGNISGVASNYPFVQPDAAKVTGTFAKAFDLFSQCHNGYNSSHHMTDGDIDKLGKNNTIINKCLCM